MIRAREDRGQAELEIGEDRDGRVLAAAVYDLHTVPSQWTMRPLSDDWREEPIGDALVWLSRVLRRVGEEAQG